MNNDHNLTTTLLKQQMIKDAVNGKKSILKKDQHVSAEIIADLFDAQEIDDEKNLDRTCINIEGGKVIGELTLTADQDAELPSIAFNQVTFDAPLSISNCRISSISFKKCNLVSIRIDNVDIESKLDLEETTVTKHTLLKKITTETKSFDSGINLSKSKLNTLSIRDAKISGELNLNKATVSGNAYLSNLNVASNELSFKF